MRLPNKQICLLSFPSPTTQISEKLLNLNFMWSVASKNTFFATRFLRMTLSCLALMTGSFSHRNPQLRKIQFWQGFFVCLFVCGKFIITTYWLYIFFYVILFLWYLTHSKKEGMEQKKINPNQHQNKIKPNKHNIPPTQIWKGNE